MLRKRKRKRRVSLCSAFLLISKNVLANFPIIVFYVLGD